MIERGTSSTLRNILRAKDTIDAVAADLERLGKRIDAEFDEDDLPAGDRLVDEVERLRGMISTVSFEVKRTVMHEVNEFADFCHDLLIAVARDDDDVVVNRAWLDKLEEIHGVVCPERAR